MTNVRPLNSELQKIALERLNESAESMKGGISELKQWIRSLHDLRVRSDEQFLVAFLRFSRYDIDKTKRHIEKFYTLRSKYSDVMRDRNPFNNIIKSVIKAGFGLPLPYASTEGGSRYILLRPHTWNPLKFTIIDIFRVCTMINDVQLICDDNWIVAGQIGIMDLKGITQEHLLQLRPDVIHTMMKLSHDIYPVRQREFHYINTPNGFEQVFNLFLSFMTDDNKSKIHIHGSNLEDFYKFIPQNLMPKEYGGSLYSIKEVASDWEEKIFYFRQYFEEEEEQFGLTDSNKYTDSFNSNKYNDIEDIENFLKSHSGECSKSHNRKIH